MKENKQSGSKPVGYFDSPNISEEEEETYIKIGKVEDRTVRMKIDTGAKITVVAKEYVPRHMFTGRSVRLRYIGGIEELLPEAEVVLNGDRKGNFQKVAVVDHMSENFDCLTGTRDHGIFRDPFDMKREMEPKVYSVMYAENIKTVLPPIEEINEVTHEIDTTLLVSPNLWDIEYIQEFEEAHSIAVDSTFTGAATTIFLAWNCS